MGTEGREGRENRVAMRRRKLLFHLQNHMQKNWAVTGLAWNAELRDWR